jgi:hypothetical protein
VWNMDLAMLLGCRTAGFGNAMSRQKENFAYHFLYLFHTLLGSKKVWAEKPSYIVQLMILLMIQSNGVCLASPLHFTSALISQEGPAIRTQLTETVQMAYRGLLRTRNDLRLVATASVLGRELFQFALVRSRFVNQEKSGMQWDEPVELTLQMKVVWANIIQNSDMFKNSREFYRRMLRWDQIESKISLDAKEADQEQAVVAVDAIPNLPEVEQAMHGLETLSLRSRPRRPKNTKKNGKEKEQQDQGCILA